MGSAGATAVAVPLFAPGRTWGANDQLAFGLVGAAGRGRYLRGALRKLGARCLAVAEVYAEFYGSESALAEEAGAIVFDAGSTYRLSAPWHSTSFGSWVW